MKRCSQAEKVYSRSYLLTVSFHFEFNSVLTTVVVK